MHKSKRLTRQWEWWWKSLQNPTNILLNYSFDIETTKVFLKRFVRVVGQSKGRYLLKLYAEIFLGGRRWCNLCSVSDKTDWNSFLHSFIRLSLKELIFNFLRLSVHDNPGDSMNSPRFWLRSRSSHNYTGRAWWKTGAQYSRTGLITVQ
jgi:hypothetical protein